MRVSELVEDLPSVEPDSFVTKVRKMMRDEKLHELPVVDDDKVQGIIRQRELLNVTSTKSNVTIGGYVESGPRISPDTDIREAAREMTRTNIDTAPVQNGNGNYVGVITMRAIFQSIDKNDLSDGTVREHMSTDVKCCYADDLVTRVWVNMVETGYTGLPVKKSGKLIGIITASDIIREGHARVKRESRKGDNAKEAPTVESLISTPVETVSPDAPLKEALEKMQSRNIGRLPVTQNEDNVVGIIDRYDVFEAVKEN